MSDYDLAESIHKLGLLVPVLKDKFGNVIDGFHRLQIDPEAKSLSLDWIDTPEKLEIARLAANYPRRIVNQDELTQRIGFLAKQGMKAKQVSLETGIPESTVFKYYPAEEKDQVKAEAGQKGGVETGIKKAALAVEQTVKTHETIAKCAYCHVTAKVKEWKTNGQTFLLCDRDFREAMLNPEHMQGKFRTLERAKQNLVPAEPAKVTPLSISKWEDRLANMQVQHSKKELAFVKLCQQEPTLTPVLQDHSFPVLETVPDAFFVRHNAVAYVDDPETHGPKQMDKDERLRELFKKHNPGWKVFVFREGKPEDWVKQVKDAV